jgi:hypothetical protein
MPRARRWISAGVLFGLLGSFVTHGSIVLALLLLFLRGGDGAGGGSGTGSSGGGENGHEGAGDTDIDVTLASPASTATAAATATATTLIPPPPTPPVVQQKTSPDEVGDLPPLPQEIPALPTRLQSATGHDDSTNGGKRPGPTRIGMPGGNGSGSGFGNGLGGDTIEGQRSLLPKAAACQDPVAGLWEALKFNPAQGNWVHFKLTVRREGTSVHGTIISRIWSGSPRDSTPPGCDFGGYDITTSMNAGGTTNGLTFTFGASHATIVMSQCSFTGQYYPDKFSGSIDESRQEFQSLNNDGAADINMPYVFRRTACVDE